MDAFEEADLIMSQLRRRSIDSFVAVTDEDQDTTTSTTRAKSFFHRYAFYLALSSILLLIPFSDKVNISSFVPPPSTTSVADGRSVEQIIQPVQPEAPVQPDKKMVANNEEKRNLKQATPCPFANEFMSELKNDITSKKELYSKMPSSHLKKNLRLQTEQKERALDGLLNENKGCWGQCDKTPGDCDYCGTGQCCRKKDYKNGVDGCELAENVNGSRCGNWRGENEELKNEGEPCIGSCGGQAGNCEFCGTKGQCCREFDGPSGSNVEGCELTSSVDWDDGGPASRCGSFAEVDGLLNENKGCWGHCDQTPGDCDYCGTGQCCREQDYENGVDGCELAEDVVGAKCGNFKGVHEGLRNAGKACRGKCDNPIGDCPNFCGTGQCCRLVDGERCEPGCELAALNWLEGGPGSQCGEFSDPEAQCHSGKSPTKSPVASPPSTNEGDDDDTSGDDTINTGELMNEGVNCGGPSECNIVGADPYGYPNSGDCNFCGSGQCCNWRDWYVGVKGCELAMNVTGPFVCGDFNSPHPIPDDFRLEEPRGVYSDETPNETGEQGGLWIKDIVATGENPSDHELPEYVGDGGQPWSKFEMALVRDILLAEFRQASTGRDETSASKFIRLPFHDCMLYEDGTGGCDGCINWEGVGFRFEGRVEVRSLEDHERKQTNNGVGDAVRFLEYIYNLDLGKSWANGCWKKPASVSGGQAWVGGTRYNPITVSSIDECKQHCLNTADCQYFTVPHMRSVGSTGPCRLYSNAGTLRENGGNGRQIAADAYCDAHESWSLQSRGKSRADLWAFASLVAVEEGINRHNWACDGDRRSPFGGNIMCTQFEGEEQCKISLDRPFIFKTGRKDCETNLEEPYQSELKENLPDDHFSGTMTVRFMEDHFKFTARETVTIMGAHTVGTFHQDQTGHKYVWTSDFQAFNNQYYRNIAGREDWFFDDDECTKVGDAWGNKGHAVWIAKMNQVYRTGAPVQWIQKKVVCPNCVARSYERGGRNAQRLAQDRDCCLNNVPEGAQCRPDGVGSIGSKIFDRDDDFSDGCEYSHFIFGTDEAALQSDMGLMYNFDVDIQGFPSGCPGLHTFVPSAHRFSDVTCGIDGRPQFEDPTVAWDDPAAVRITKNEWTDKGCPAGCPKNDFKYPGDDLTMADHVERFADDQHAWINEFIPVMEKMISNGYEESDLVVSFSG